MCYSQGFNPHPRFSFGPSLRTGWEGCGEYLDAFLERPCGDIVERCTRQLPDGLRILESGTVGEGVPKLAADITGSRYDVRLTESDVCEPRPEGETSWMDGASGVGVSQVQRKHRVLEALAATIVERFGAGRPGGPAGEADDTRRPVVLEARCSETGGETDASVMIEYVSTMHGGKSLFPEDILTPFLGAPTGYATPVRVTRTALYVERGGEYVSPMSRAALETRR